MAEWTIEGVNSALATWLGAAAGVQRVQDGANPSEVDGGLSEGMNDPATLQVYWQSGGSADDWHQTTLKGGVIQTTLTYHGDVYVRQRSNLSEDIAACLPMASALYERLYEAAQQSPNPTYYFDYDGIRAFRFTVERVEFTYGGFDFVGIRFIIELRIY